MSDSSCHRISRLHRKRLTREKHQYYDADWRNWDYESTRKWVGRT